MQLPSLPALLLLALPLLTAAAPPSGAGMLSPRQLCEGKDGTRGCYKGLLFSCVNGQHTDLVRCVNCYKDGDEWKCP